MSTDQDGDTANRRDEQPPAAHKESGSLRLLPAVNRLADWIGRNHGGPVPPRPELIALCRQVLTSKRQQILSGSLAPGATLTIDALAAEVEVEARRQRRTRLIRVVNATGVIIHTGLGRAPLSSAARRALNIAAGGYSNLEFDLASGRRGSRTALIRDLVCRLTGAEDALVVNNNAAAVMLALNTLANKREVIVSRGELVEIGGGFRIPDVMRSSGVRMVEVGTTNKTYLGDYERAVTSDTALLVKVHPSNFHLTGFTHDVPLAELAALGRRLGIPVMHDLGGGNMVPLPSAARAPLVIDSINAGATVVMFSGDKLLGGPQCGIIAGSYHAVGAMGRNPLMRALRVGKLTYAALAATLDAFFDPANAVRHIPALRMLSAPPVSLVPRARNLKHLLEVAAGPGWTFSLVRSRARAGGGALPGYSPSSIAISVTRGPFTADQVQRALREFDPPVIVRIVRDRVLIDVRTLFRRDFPDVSAAFQHLAGNAVTAQP